MTWMLVLMFQFTGDKLPTVPGYANPAVTQANIKTTICKSGWTKTIRPPSSYTNKLKLEQMAAGHLKGKPSEFEEDHRLPLEAGGHPTDQRNLWPQPWNGKYGAHAKDRLENRIHRDLCASRLSLSEAQAVFLGDWIAAYDSYFGSGRK